MGIATRRFTPNYKGWLGFVRECPDAQVISIALADVASLRRTARGKAPMVKEIALKVARERGLDLERPKAEREVWQHLRSKGVGALAASDVAELVDAYLADRPAFDELVEIVAVAS